MSNPFVLNRNVVQTGGFAMVTASLAPSFWGSDKTFRSKSAFVDAKWSSIEFWIYWVISMCHHGADRHISKIRWEFDINDESASPHTFAYDPSEQGEDGANRIADIVIADLNEMMGKTIEDIEDEQFTHEDQISCTAWTRYDDDDESMLHQVFNFDWVVVKPTVFDESNGFADLYDSDWYQRFGGDTQ